MVKIFTGSFDELVRFIFKIYDCDNDCKITKEDVKLILSYIPIDLLKSQQSNLDKFLIQCESLEEIASYIKKLFKEEEELDEWNFKRFISEDTSEPFLFVSSLIKFRF